MRRASLQEIMATRACATFSCRINFDFIGLNNKHDMNRWCEEHCKGLWRSETFHALYWQFELEKDATMFMLRWGSAEGNKLR
jgi:hypothetical protein